MNPIQTPLKAAGAALALSAALLAPAHADTTQFVVFTLATSGTGQSASFSDIVGSIGSFTDDYVFASPPALTNVTFTGTAGTDITFTSIALYYYGDTTPQPLAGSFSSTAFNESDGAVTSAVYVLEIKGVSNSTTASYSGTISAVAAVPEPASWGLMALGLLGCALQVRRRAPGSTAA